MCIDYRKLNSQLPEILANRSPGAVTLVDIPKADEMLERLPSSNFFTSLDLRCGNYHIKISPQTRHKSAFTIICGKYKFLRMPFGLAYGPEYFAALMQKVLEHLMIFV